MIRRMAFVLIAVVLAVPAGSAAKGPLPTAGIAYVHEWDLSFYSDRVTFAFFGSIQLDGGSRVGFWGLEANVQNGAFGPTPISDQDIGIPFPSGLPVGIGFANEMRSAGAASESSASGPWAQKIEGSCSGKSGLILTWNLTCEFLKPGGLSVTRRIDVFTPIFDVTDLPCDFFCEPTKMDTEAWGIYTRNISAL
jgi:hypothetical protein